MTAPHQDEFKPLTPRDWAAFFAMVFGMFMAILDIQIVSSSISEIRAGLSASADESSWVQTSYLIAEVIMIPISGFLTRMLSTRILFAIACAVFTLMSLGCALASNLDAMIVLRALQGFFGGALIPTVFATTYKLFPPEKRASSTVLIGLVATMAPTIGPTLGGFLTQHFSWHWLFLINIIPGIIVTTLVWFLVDVDKPDHSLLKGFDLPGVFSMALFLGTLEYVMEEGPRNDWLQDPVLAWLAFVCVLSGLFFFVRVLTYSKPIVDLYAFRDRNFAVGCLYSFILGVGLYGSVYIVPLFFAQVRGFNSLQIGIVMIVTGMFQFISAPLSGAMAKHMDHRLMMSLGLGLFGLGVYLTTFLTPDWGFHEMFLPQAIRGLSLMMCFIPINNLALGTLPLAQLNNASGLYNLMRNLGGAIGLAIINTILIERQALHQSRLSDHLTLSNPLVQNFLNQTTHALTPQLGDQAPAAALKRLSLLLTREATVLSFNDCLLIMAGVFFAAILLMPLVKKPKRAAGGGH